MNVFEALVIAVVILSVGGIAYLFVWSEICKFISTANHKRRIYEWLLDNTDKWRFRSTQAIARSMYLTEDRVRYICSHHKKIVLSTGEKEDMWGIKNT